MGRRAVTGADVLARLNEWGTVSLRDGRIEAQAGTPPPAELRALVDEHRDSLKAAILLMNPPPWLTRLFDLYWSGHETQVRLTGTSGKAEVFMVSVSIKNICAAVAAEIGAPVLEWERLRPEVEEALGSWEGGA